jgi:hypothetical protein
MLVRKGFTFIGCLLASSGNDTLNAMRKTTFLLTIPQRSWYYSPAKKPAISLAGRPFLKRGESYQR